MKFITSNKTIAKVANFIGYGSVVTLETNPKNLGKSIMPLQMQRIKQDTLTWRLAVEEMERAYFPYRVQVQQLYLDTILNGHVSACMERRKDLSLLREGQVVLPGGAVDEKCTELLNEKWFSDFKSLAWDALPFGYSLISLGDVTDGLFKDIQTIKRWNISPDRYVVASVPYNPEGTNFLTDVEAKKWHVYVPTPNNIGTSPCGYGFLYAVAVYEIFLRNILGYNGDFVELYSQPYRIGKTNKTEEAERNAFEQAVAEMGSAGYMITDTDGDTVEFLETQLGGTGWQGYENFEKRLEAKISKLILGHADGLDSVPGKLGAGTGEDNPVAEALKDKQSKDGTFLCDIINTELFPRLRALGFPIPKGAKYEFKNDSEINENNTKLTNLAVNMKKAGLQIDSKYYEDQTGIKVAIPEQPEPPKDETKVDPKKDVKESIKNKLEKIYS